MWKIWRPIYLQKLGAVLYQSAENDSIWCFWRTKKSFAIDNCVIPHCRSHTGRNCIKFSKWRMAEQVWGNWKHSILLAIAAESNYLFFILSPLVLYSVSTAKFPNSLCKIMSSPRKKKKKKSTFREKFINSTILMFSSIS